MSSFSNSGRAESPISSPAPGGGGGTTRLKQSKRDEAIRKKIENELSRKRNTIPSSQSTQSNSGRSNNNSRQGGGKSAAKKGTVAGLKPSPALTVPESMTVADASQLCAAKRSDCVLVVDHEEGLSGIFTAKDLAFRVTAESLDPRNTPVSAIMTRNPMVTRDTTSATEALQLMVSRGFRHLPVCNEEGDVVGLLDITKVFHEALAKVERGSSASAQLSAALAGVQSELGPGLGGNNPQAAAMLAYVDSLREKMALPDLNSVLDPSKPAATVGPRTSVKEAAMLMKERRTTAVCVMEMVGGQQKIVGIFTSKDVVLRVIAAGLDSQRCSVVRVMTPHPDTAHPSMFVQDALKKMHIGHYLNLPVVESDGRLVGIVDVLKLTYATLEQIGNMHGNAEGSSDVGSNGGPMWGKFFDSLNQGDADDDDVRSAISGSHAAPSSSGGALRTPSRPSQMRADSSYMNPASPDIGPGDSASAVGGDDASDVGGGKKGATAASEAAKSAIVVDDGTYIFKFKTPSGRTHRFQARNDMLDNLREIVTGKLTSDPFFIFDEPLPPTTTTTATQEDDLIVSSSPVSGSKPDPADFTLSYTDDDGDLIHMTSDGDVVDAVKVARAQGSDRVVLYLSGGKVWEDAIKAQNAPPAAPPAAPAVLPTSATISSPLKSTKNLPLLEEEIESPAPVGPSPAATPTPPPAPAAPTPTILTPSTPPPPPPPSHQPSNNNNNEKTSFSSSFDPDPAKEPTLATASSHTKIHVSPSALAAANAHVESAGDGSIAGIPKDLLLPASIGFLGVAVLAVFALTRGSK